MDRLAELKSRSRNAAPASAAADASVAAAVEADRRVMAQYDEIATITAAIEANAVQMHGLRDTSRLATTNAQRKNVAAKLRKLRESTVGSVQLGKRVLHDRAASNSELKAKSGANADVVQASTNLFQRHATAFRLAIVHFQTASEAIEDQAADTAIRRLTQVGMPAEEAKQLVESAGADQALQLNVVEIAMSSENLDEMVADLQARHDDIVKLEASVLEVHALFQDLAMLVDIQADQLNNIEKHVVVAKDKTSEGEGHLKEAEVYQRKAQKRGWILAGLAALGLAGIVTPSVLVAM